MLLAVLLPFVLSPLAACAGAALHRSGGERRARLTGVLAALAFVPALLLALRLPGQAAGLSPAADRLGWVPALGLSLDFRGDGFSLLFAVLIGVVGALASLYSVFYLSARENFGRFFSYLLLFGGAMLGLVLCDNLVGLFAFWELTSVSSFLLIGLWHRRAAARDGAIKAFLVSALGGLALLAAAALITLGGGSSTLSGLDVAAFRSSSAFTPALLLVILAAATKSAQLPFQLWLPTAMEAPTPVSAFLHSATMVKAGVLLVAKFGPLFAVSALWGGILVPLGLATLIYGAYLALRQTDLKALLAYSTVSQLGLLMSLYGLGGEEGRFAATLGLLNHAAFKAALFFVVGVVDHAAHTRETGQLSGLGRRMPLTAAAALVAAMSMAGLPPLGGFISKELFYEATLHASPWFIGAAVLGSVLTFAYSGRLLSVFVGPLKAPDPRPLHEAGAGLLLPPALLAGAALLFGLWPASAEALTRTAARSLGYQGYGGHLALWHGLNPALLLSALTWVLGAALIWQRRRVAAAQQRLRPGWNANTLYFALLTGVNVLASRFTARTQGLALPDQLRVTLIFAALLAGYGVSRAAGQQHPLTLPPLTLLAICVLLLAGAGGVLFSRNRLTAVVLTGLTGFGSAAAFLALQAPDLALTQLVIEAITVILFLLAFRALPGGRDLPRGRFRQLLDVAVAGAAGLGSALLVIYTIAPLAPPISDFYVQNAYKGGGGKNVVNVLLVDFRGFDTLGEIAVVSMVALGVVALTRLGQRGPQAASPDAAADAVTQRPLPVTGHPAAATSTPAPSFPVPEEPV